MYTSIKDGFTRFREFIKALLDLSIFINRKTQSINQ